MARITRSTNAVGIRRWVRLYLALDSKLNWLLSAMRGAFDGLWLGLLDHRHLIELDRAYYDSEPMYVDEEYNRSGLHEWEQRIVDEYFAPHARIAVTGAGGGREVLALLEQGFDVTGFEPNAQLAAFGSSLTTASGHGDRLVQCRRDGWPGGEQQFDVVLVGWGAYMLIPGRGARVRFLRQAVAATSGSGALAISYFALPSNRVRFRAAQAVSRRIATLRGREQPVLGDALGPNYVHFFTAGQIADEFAAAGLEVLSQGVGGIDVDGYGWTVGRRSAQAGL